MKIGPNGPTDGGKNERNQIIIPKDNLMATLMASLMKFKDGLNDQKAKSDNPLPRFYRRVIYFNFSIIPQFLVGVEFHRVCLDHPGRHELPGNGAW